MINKANVENFKTTPPLSCGVVVSILGIVIVIGASVLAIGLLVVIKPSVEVLEIWVELDVTGFSEVLLLVVGSSVDWVDEISSCVELLNSD